MQLVCAGSATFKRKVVSRKFYEKSTWKTQNIQETFLLIKAIYRTLLADYFDKKGFWTSLTNNDVMVEILESYETHFYW